MAEGTLKLHKPGYREFNAMTNEAKKVRCSVRLPTQKELSAADLEMSGAFNRAIEAGLPTRSRIVRHLRKNGLWSETQERDYTAIRNELGSVEAQIRENKFASDEDKKKLTDRRDELNNSSREMQAEFESMLAHTSDNKAEEAHRNFLIACVCEYAPKNPDGSANPLAGRRIWDSVDNFLSDPDNTLGQRVVYEFMACQQEVPSEWTLAEERAEKEAADKEAADAAEAAAKAAAADAPITDNTVPAEAEAEVRISGTSPVTAQT